MAEILTESFCERCGARYTFETTAPRRRGLGRIRTLSRGVKDFVANDDASFTEAMSAAREDDARRASLQQLEAFQQTFAFCMTCRQYTCQNCWNSSAGECLSCAPDLSREVLAQAFPDLAPDGPESQTGVSRPTHPTVAASAWPTADRRIAGEPPIVAGPPSMEPVDATTVGAVDVDLTPEELAAIHGVLSRQAGRPGDEAVMPPAIGQEPAGLAISEVHQVPADAMPIAAFPGDVPDSIADPRADTRRFLGRFRPGLHRASPDLTALAETGAADDAVSMETVARIEPPTSGPAAAEEPAVVAVPEPDGAAPKPHADVLVAAALDLEAITPEPFGAHETAPAPPEARAAAPEPEAVASEPEAVAPEPEAVAPEPEAVAPEPEAVAPEPEAVGAPEPEAVASVSEPEAALEAVVGPEPEAVAPEPVAAGAPEPEAVAPEPVAAVPEAAAAPPEPVEERVPGQLPPTVPEWTAAPAPTAPEPVAAPTQPRTDVAVQPAWRMVAPDGGPASEPQPAPPAWVTPGTGIRRTPDAMPAASWAARVATGRPLDSPVWAASSRNILAATSSTTAGPAAVQSCVSCGLSLSASARFCRRCGTRQG